MVTSMWPLRPRLFCWVQNTRDNVRFPPRPNIAGLPFEYFRSAMVALAASCVILRAKHGGRHDRHSRQVPCRTWRSRRQGRHQLDTSLRPTAPTIAKSTAPIQMLKDDLDACARAMKRLLEINRRGALFEGWPSAKDDVLDASG